MRKWLQAAIGGKQATKCDDELEEAKRREGNVDQALLDLIAQRKEGSQAGFNSEDQPDDQRESQSFGRGSRDRPWLQGAERSTRDGGDVALHDRATVSQSPFGTHASKSPAARRFERSEGYGFTDGYGTTDDFPEAFTEKPQVKIAATAEEALKTWVCGICAQRDNTGDACAVCYRPRGATLNRDYMTVTELTQDIVEGLKRQRDHRGISGAKTETKWNSRTPAQSQRVQHAQTQVRWQDQNRGVGLGNELHARTPFAGSSNKSATFSGSTNKSATFSGTSRSAASLPAASSTTSGFRLQAPGPSPPLPSLSSLPCSTAAGPPLPARSMQRSSSTPGEAATASNAYAAASRQQSFDPEPSLATRSTAHMPPPPPLPANMRGAKSAASFAAPEWTMGGPSASSSSWGAGNGNGARSPSGTPPGIKPGCAVSISSSQRLHGSVGTVRAWDRMGHCWKVDLPSGETKSVRHEDLEVLTAAQGLGGARAPSPAGRPAASPVGRSAGAHVVGPPLLPGARASLDSNVMAGSAMLNAMGSSKQIPPGFKGLSRSPAAAGPSFPWESSPEGSGQGSASSSSWARGPSPNEHLAPLEQRAPPRRKPEINSFMQELAAPLPPPELPTPHPMQPLAPLPQHASQAVPQPRQAAVQHVSQVAAQARQPVVQQASQAAPQPRQTAVRRDTCVLPLPKERSTARVPVDADQSRAQQRSHAQAKVRPPASAAPDDQDPMAMLMAQMQNLDRVKGKMQSSCA